MTLFVAKVLLRIKHNEEGTKFNSWVLFILRAYVRRHCITISKYCDIIVFWASLEGRTPALEFVLFSRGFFSKFNLTSIKFNSMHDWFYRIIGIVFIIILLKPKIRSDNRGNLSNMTACYIEFGKTSNACLK